MAVSSLPPSAWSNPSTIEDTGVHHGYRRVVLVQAGYWRAEADLFRFALDEFSPVFDAWLSWIDPGGFILPHRDAGPYRERWQVPVHAAGDLGGAEAEDGVPFPVRHWERHSVRNDTDHPRVHIVLDRDVVLPVKSQPFQTFTEVA